MAKINDLTLECVNWRMCFYPGFPTHSFPELTMYLMSSESVCNSVPHYDNSFICEGHGDNAVIHMDH